MIPGTIRAPWHSFLKSPKRGSKKKSVQFLSDHPNPENRVGRMQEEVALRGGLPPGHKTESHEFEETKHIVYSLPLKPNYRTQTEPFRGDILRGPTNDIRFLATPGKPRGELVLEEGIEPTRPLPATRF
jgi:hypothetical protein